MSDPLDPIFVVVFFCCSILSQLRRAHSRDLIDFAGWYWQVAPEQGLENRSTTMATARQD